MSKKIVIGRNATLLGPPPRSDTRGYFSPGAASAYVAFSTDGRRLAAVALEGGSWLGNRYEGGKYVVRLWDTATGRLRHEADAGDDCSPQFSAEGYTFLLNGPRGISVRETLTGLVRLSSRGSLGGYRAAVAPSGEVVAVHLRNPDGKAGKIHVQQTETGGELAQLPADHDATALAFSPAGNLLATGGTDGALLLWDGRGRWDRRPLPVAELSEEELVKLWSDLSGPDSGRAYQAMRRLLPAPRQAVSLLRKHIRTVTAAELRQMAQLIADLDNKSFQVRQRAAAQLERLGEVAEPLVRAALEGGPSLEARRRLEQLLPKVTNILASPARLGNARALEVLDRLGTAEARRLLEELARGAPEDWVTQEASASVRRLARGSPAP